MLLRLKKTFFPTNQEDGLEVAKIKLNDFLNKG